MFHPNVDVKQNAAEVDWTTRTNRGRVNLFQSNWLDIVCVPVLTYLFQLIEMSGGMGKRALYCEAKHNLINKRYDIILTVTTGIFLQMYLKSVQ